MMVTTVISFNFLLGFVLKCQQDYSPIFSLLTTEQYCLLDAPRICLAVV